MEAKLKMGDRVVVSADCDHAMGYGPAGEFAGKSGVVAGVYEYNSDICQTDYDVILDNFGPQNARSCPGFEEQWLTLEAV